MEFIKELNLDEDKHGIHFDGVSININSTRIFLFLFGCNVGSTNTIKSRRQIILSSAMIAECGYEKKMIEDDDDDATHLNSLFFISHLCIIHRSTPLRIGVV